MSNTERQSLYEKLRELSDSDYYPFHMPGHKRNGEHYPLGEFYKMDITEIDDFDNLHEPEEIIQECMTLVSHLYGSYKSYLLVNGSTCGILSAISASVPRGGKLLLARNSHKSAYHAVFLNELETKYLYPEYIEEYDLPGKIQPEQVEKALCEETDIKAVFITSPTYDGIISDIGKIVRICHNHGIICIVDEAHGAHLGLFEKTMLNSVELGADVVIHSVHKTLPAPTQTALLHINGKLLDRVLLEYYLRIFQTSSPSYLLVAGIDECFRILKKQGKALFLEFRENKEEFYFKTKTLKNIQVLMDINYCMDSMKLIISVKNTSLSGKELYEILRNRYHLQMEMYSDTYVLAIVTVMDKREGFIRLAAALSELDGEIFAKESIKQVIDYHYCSESPVAIQTIYAAQMQKKEEVKLEQAQGRISGVFLNLYPPGIPIVVPGEEITEEIMAALEYFCSNNYKIQGMDIVIKKLIVVKDERYGKM